MIPDVVVDASVIVALLTDRGPRGDAIASTLESARLCAPTLMPYEVTHVVRRFEAARLIDGHEGESAITRLVDLPVELVDFGPLAPRIWQLRQTVTAYDASYVALAEALDLALITLDSRLARASGIRCAVVVAG